MSEERKVDEAQKAYLDEKFNNLTIRMGSIDEKVEKIAEDLNKSVEHLRANDREQYIRIGDAEKEIVALKEQNINFKSEMLDLKNLIADKSSKSTSWLQAFLPYIVFGLYIIIDKFG